MLHQIEEERLEEYIAYKVLELKRDIVEELSIIRDETEFEDTKKFLQHWINHYSKQYHVCKNCFDDLVPIIARERYDELDRPYYREYICGYECVNCGKKYDY